ncbi:MAG: ABC transporter ATP-binding protein [bacterium]|nr:ABC transporter ATP-binding protein [bacterium]
MNIFHTIRYLLSLFRRAFWGYKSSIALMAILSFLSGLLEGIGVTAIIPLFSFIGGGGGAASDSISLLIAEFFKYFHLPYTARFLLIFMVAVFLAKALFLFISQQITSKITADFEWTMRARLLAATFHARWRFLSSQKMGHLDQMLTTEVSNSSAILYYLSGGMLVVDNLVIYSFLTFNISPAVALFSLVAGTVIFVVLLPLLGQTKRISGDMVLANKGLAHFASEHIFGAKTVKSMNLEDPVLERGAGSLTLMRGLYMRLAFWRNLTASLLQLVGVFFIIGLFAFLYKTSAFHFASFAVVVYALNKVITNVQYAQNHAHAISAQVPYLESLLRYQDEASQSIELDAGTKPFAFEKDIAFAGVNFEYREGEPALHDVCFSIKKGEVVGLIGPSGSGKTTVVDLLLRLIEPVRGSILVDGMSVSEVRLREWRRHIGYMSQDIFLQNDTIENNIKFYDASVSEKDMVAAAKQAAIYEFIQGLPQGFATQVGERGLALSGGERQRIALARVLARKPTLLILDEATSALDSESEALIRQAIERVKGDLTVLVIAHRLSTIIDADTLLVLEDGNIVEKGAPRELLSDEHSRFAKMYHQSG